MGRREALMKPRPLPEDLTYTPGRLRELMKLAGLKRAEVAELVGVAASTVEKYLLPEDSKNRRVMPLPAWELLLLKLDRHPYFTLTLTVAGERDG